MAAQVDEEGVVVAAEGAEARFEEVAFAVDAVEGSFDVVARGGHEDEGWVGDGEAELVVWVDAEEFGGGWGW